MKKAREGETKAGDMKEANLIAIINLATRNEGRKEGVKEWLHAYTPIVAWQQRRAFVFTRFGVASCNFITVSSLLSFSLSLSLSLSSSSSSSSHSLFSWVMHFSLSPTILMHHQFSSFSFLWKAFQEIS